MEERGKHRAREGVNDGCSENHLLTRKKSCVEDDSRVPYSTSVCLARSSAELIGVTIRSTVKKAAKLAVYDEIMISVKNHHTPPTIRPDTDLKTC